MEALISVIVPIYKIDRYLGVCIESIINQTYKNLEIILVDDGSPDRCSEICDLYAKKDSRIRVIHKQNGGLVSARKAGMLAANGEYIGYVDGDDWIGQGFYHALYSTIAENDSDVVIAGYSRDLFSHSKALFNSMPSGIYKDGLLKELYSSMISKGDFFEHGITTYLWNKLFKRDIVFEAQMGVDERITIGEDAAVTYPALLQCKKVCIIDNCSYHYRQREDSMLKLSGNFEKEACRLKLLFNHLMNCLEKSAREYNLKEQIEDYITATYIIRSGGKLNSNDKELSCFPLNTNIVGKRILLYGAGTFGQQFKNRLEDEGLCCIVGWVDDDYWEYRRCCMDVDSIERVTLYDYDYVLIVSLNPVAVEEAKRKLMDYGVLDKMIISLDTTKEIRDKALNEYFDLSIWKNTDD